MKNSSLFSKYLVAWGVQPEGEISLSRNFSCPNCRDFSYFSYCDPKRWNSGRDWRRATVGFMPFSVGSSFAGIAVIECPDCGTKFGVTLTESVFPSYVRDCPRWMENCP